MHFCPDAPRIKKISKLVVDEGSTVASNAPMATLGKVPELTRSVGIQLNERVSLRRKAKAIA
jgi:pyruvate/2-oxoglutarate dehydrogenase complex dihydrolipoamide acyltransferase (E2) component